jgi:hypothetical protein
MPCLLVSLFDVATCGFRGTPSVTGAEPIRIGMPVSPSVYLGQLPTCCTALVGRVGRYPDSGSAALRSRETAANLTQRAAAQQSKCLPLEPVRRASFYVFESTHLLHLCRRGNCWEAAGGIKN